MKTKYTSPEQLVEFRTAKLAKEKGFNLFCHHAFLLKFKSPIQWDEVERELNTGEEVGIPTAPNTEYMVKVHNQWRNRNVTPQIVARPTQTALSKWLREMKGIYIELIIDGWGDDKKVSAEDIGYRAFIWQIGQPKPHPADDLGMSSYEQIMEIALRDALDLIENDEKN